MASRIFTLLTIRCINNNYDYTLCDCDDINDKYDYYTYINNTPQFLIKIKGTLTMEYVEGKY